MKPNENHNKSTGVLFLLLKKHENEDNLLGILRDINGKTTFLNCFKLSNHTEYGSELKRISTEAIYLAKNTSFLNVFAVILESSFQNYNNSDNISFLKCHIQIANSVAEDEVNGSKV